MEIKRLNTSTAGQSRPLNAFFAPPPTHLVQTGPETAGVSRHRRTWSRCICLCRSLMGFGVPARLSLRCCRLSSWIPAQSSCLCMDRKSHPFACVFLPNMCILQIYNCLLSTFTLLITDMNKQVYPQIT